jgi:hypothetical protein
LLALFDEHPSVRWHEIPAELHNAWRLAWNRQLIQCEARLAEAARHEPYRQS